jgi:hemerythrin-like domain-containing protein
MMQSIDPLARTSYAKEVKITDRFIGDHKTFRKMLFELGQMAGEPIGTVEAPRLVRLVELFKDHFLVHAWAEDTFFYPAVRAVLPKAPPPFCLRYLEELEDEHKAVESDINHLELQVRRHPPQIHWPDTYAHFFQALQTHLKKEEEQLFPLSERIFGAGGLEKLSQDLEENRYKAPPARQHIQVS